MKVGIVGLGDQGSPMAERLLGTGLALTVVARREAVQDEFRRLGAEVAPTVEELGARCNLVGVVVRNDTEVTEVVGELLTRMASGGVIAVHSTVNPQTCRTLADAAAQRGVTLIDAPVSGGPEAARHGSLIVMVGSDEATFRSVEPIFAAFATLVRRVGAVGSGQLAKIINNFYSMAHEATALEEIALADAAGLERGPASEVLAAGSGATWQFGYFAGRGFAQKPYPAGDLARVAMMERELDLLSSLDFVRTADLTATTTVIRAYLERLRAVAGAGPTTAL